MNDYKPLPEWNKAVQRADKERKEACDRLSEKFRLKNKNKKGSKK